MNNSQIIYVTDPLCLWCYGIAPDLEAFYQALPDDIECTTINGGLFPAERARTADSFFRDYLKEAAQQVHQYTGQEFGKPFWDLLETPGFRYDTEPSAKASVAVKHLKDEAAMRAFIHRLQKAVFIDGANPNDASVLADVAHSLGIEKQAFLDRFNAQENTQATHNEYEQTRSIGVKGFPALFYVHQQQGFALASGYTTLEQLNESFNRARERSGQTAATSDDRSAATEQPPNCSNEGCKI